MKRELDPPAFARAMHTYHDALRAHEASINSLNVYPVPDGDTGTNLRLTQQAVVDGMAEMEGRSKRDGDASDPAAMARAVSHAALMGARGNSGVILSQVLRAMAGSLSTAASAAGVAAMLGRASAEADRAVGTPVEGTMLSVLRAAAAAAAERAAGSDDADATRVLDDALEAARTALARTTEQLPELAEAGVVDAGGKGIVVLLDALRSAITGDPPSEPLAASGPVGRGGDRRPERREVTQAFEVQILVETAENRDLTPLRNRLARIGDSLVVVGGGGLFNVHVHTDQPDAAIEAVRGTGTVRETSVVDLRAAVEGCLADQARAVRVEERQAAALVAVADGDGVSATLRSLGASVVRGGPGNNPAVGDLVVAVDQAPSDGVIVLPNHPNVMPAARRAADATSKDARVIETRSLPAGIAAATAFNPIDPVDDNERAMSKAAEAVRSGEVVRAERDARTPAGAVRAGQWMGMVEGRAVAVGRPLAETVADVAAAVLHQDAELLTVLVGADAKDADRREVTDVLLRAHPDVEVQVLDGGQPRYAFVIGAE